MGLFLAVAESSRCEPQLITLEYLGKPSSKDLTLVVGKGVTYDTGGLNLKPTGSMEDMRGDMAGSASALGLIKAAAGMKLKCNITVVIAATENSIDADSYKPGDTYEAMSGKSVEIVNTDAEGRLTLADALTFGQRKFKPNRILDMATLTGAIVIALGSERSGLFSNNATFAKACFKAGERCGEKVWQMPMDKEYMKLLKSNVADMKNCGKRSASSTTAALFLQEFIEDDTPWIHLDIAGTGHLEEGDDYYLTMGSGVGVRLILELLENLHVK